MSCFPFFLLLSLKVFLTYLLLHQSETRSMPRLDYGLQKNRKVMIQLFEPSSTPFPSNIYLVKINPRCMRWIFYLVATHSKSCRFSLFIFGSIWNTKRRQTQKTHRLKHKNGFIGLIPLTPGPSQGVTHTPTGYRLWGSSGTRGEQGNDKVFATAKLCSATYFMLTELCAIDFLHLFPFYIALPYHFFRGTS